MNNKILGNILIASVSVGFLTGFFEESLAYATTEMLYAVSGIGIVVFGFWAGLRLRSQNLNRE